LSYEAADATLSSPHSAGAGDEVMGQRLLRYVAAGAAGLFTMGAAVVTPVAEAQSLPCQVYCRRGCIQMYGLPENNPAFEACFNECVQTDCMASR
jgi:hypothetical protein